MLWFRGWRKEGTAVLGMKPLAFGAIPKAGIATAMSGKYEGFKTTTRFDGTPQRPAKMG